MNNRRYIGEYTYRDIVVPDGIPAIVPQDLFDRVQEKLAKNKKAPARHKAEDDYLLTTKLFCGYEMLMDLVWEEDYTYYSRKAVNNHVSNLRRKIKVAPDVPDYVKSVYGIGYKFEEK